MVSSVADYRLAARRRLSRLAFDYLDGGAEDGDALKRYINAYKQWLFKPRVLRDVSICSTATRFFGREAAAPMIVGPTGLNGLFWPRADELLAQAASRAGLPFALSTASTSLLEDVRAAAPQGDLWMQLYVQQDRGIAEDIMRRASAAGFSTLLLTVDVPVHGKRDHDTRNGFKLPLKLTPKLIADCVMHPRWSMQMARFGSPQLKNIAKSVGERADLSRHSAMLSRQMDLSLGWTDLDWVRQHWSGNVVVKGVMSADDATLALKHSADGIVVSNHGGRQLGSTFAPMEVLPRIVDAVGDSMTVLIDGGVRRGSDALKAVALGARGVLLGRAPLYGVAASGLPGAAGVLDLMMDEMLIAMRLLGCQTLADLGSAFIGNANDVVNHAPRCTALSAVQALYNPAFRSDLFAFRNVFASLRLSRLFEELCLHFRPARSARWKTLTPTRTASSAPTAATNGPRPIPLPPMKTKHPSSRTRTATCSPTAIPSC